MLQAIKVEVKNVYGKPTIYPVCAKAKLFAELCGTKTLNHGDLCRIEALGFEIVQVQSNLLADIFPA